MILSRWMITLLLLVVFAAGANAQGLSLADRDGSGRPAAAQAPAAPGHDKTSGSAPGAAQTAQAAASEWKFEVDPLYVWVPFFSSSVTLPELPDLPSPPGGATDKTKTSLNGAVMLGLRLEKGKFLARGNLLYAGLDADRENPNLKVSLNLTYGELFGGWAVARNLHLEGGVRRIAADASATFLTYPKVETKPGFWDPLIGLSYKSALGRKWQLVLHGDGGGFGVGSDLDVCFSAGLDWRAASHFGMSFGYQAVYLRFAHTVLESTSLSKELKFGALMQGPTLGVRILF